MEILNTFKNKYGINPKEYFYDRNTYGIISDFDYKRIKDELEYLSDGTLCKLYIIKIISDFMRNNNQYFLSRGSLSNSFVLFKLGVTNVDLYKYNLPHEVLFGIRGKKEFNISINIAKSFKDKIIKFITDTFKDDLYYKMFLNKDGKLSYHNDSSFLIYLGDNFNYKVSLNNSKKYIEEDYFNLINNNEFISLDFIELESFEELNTLKSECGEPKTDILNDKNIIDNFFHYRIGGIEINDEIIDYNFADALDNGCDSLLILARIIGAYHGTNVAKNAINHVPDFNYVNFLRYPLTRDEIMAKCTNNIFTKDEAYKIMEFIRKGNRYRTKNKEIWNEWLKIKEKLIDAFDEDYVDYLEKIEYIFPLGYSLEYAQYYFYEMYYKVYHYDEFYKIKTESIKDLINLDTEKLYEIKKILKDSRDFNKIYKINLILEDRRKNILTKQL